MLNGGDHEQRIALRVSIDQSRQTCWQARSFATEQSDSRRCRTPTVVAARSRDTVCGPTSHASDWSVDVATERCRLDAQFRAASAWLVRGARAQAEMRSTVASSAQCRSSNTSTSVICAVIDSSASADLAQHALARGAEDLSLQHVPLFAPDQGRKLDQPGGRRHAQRLNHQMGRRPAA